MVWYACASYTTSTRSYRSSHNALKYKKKNAILEKKIFCVWSNNAINIHHSSLYLKISPLLPSEFKWSFSFLGTTLHTTIYFGALCAVLICIMHMYFMYPIWRHLLCKEMNTNGSLFQVIKARFGNRTHQVFCLFAFFTNLIVMMSLTIAGTTVLNSLVKVRYCIWLISSPSSLFSNIFILTNTMPLRHKSTDCNILYLFTFKIGPKPRTGRHVTRNRHRRLHPHRRPWRHILRIVLQYCSYFYSDFNACSWSVLQSIQQSGESVWRTSTIIRSDFLLEGSQWKQRWKLFDFLFSRYNFLIN